MMPTPAHIQARKGLSADLKARRLWAEVKALPAPAFAWHIPANLAPALAALFDPAPREQSAADLAPNEGIQL